MNDDSQPSNWVDRRGHREQLLKDHSGDYWHRLRGAIQDACASFEKLYPHPHAICTLENGGRIRISRELPIDPMTRTAARTLYVLVSYRSDDRTIVVANAAGAQHWLMDLDANFEFFLLDRQRKINVVEPDEFSEMVLQPILFPNG